MPESPKTSAVKSSGCSPLLGCDGVCSLCVRREQSRLKAVSFQARCGLISRSKRAQFVPQVTCASGTPFYCRKDWRPVGPHKPGSRGSIPRPATISVRYGGHQLVQQSLQNFACSGQHRVSVPLSIKMEFVVYQLALQSVKLPERVQTPSNSPSSFYGLLD